LELVGQAARQSGHNLKLVDLQVEPKKEYFRLLQSWEPEVVAISANYLANFPEIIDLSKTTKRILPGCYIIVGGHSASFVPGELLEHSEGTIDCVLTGEGEGIISQLLEAINQNKDSAPTIPGVFTKDGVGPSPQYINSLDNVFPARDLARKRRKYFMAMLDPCASIEFSRGCPWNCSFCSAWTFYGRKFRLIHPEKVVDDLEQIKEGGVFVVDDVAFTNKDHSITIGEEILRRGIKKQFYIETRADVLIRNQEVFNFWKQVGLTFMFVGLEAIDDAGLDRFRKRLPLSKNFEALEVAHKLGIATAINLIADPDWDRERFETIRKWAIGMAEFVNLSVFTPYPGTEAWLTESRPLISRDYRLFDMYHSVLPTRLQLDEFYEELVKTQISVNRDNVGWKDLLPLGSIVLGQLARGQTNFLRMLVRFNSRFDPKNQLGDHRRTPKYELNPPAGPVTDVDLRDLCVLGRD
jgi:hopanoid C-3 methylase HpnR